jgi:hypothetical protein
VLLLHHSEIRDLTANQSLLSQSQATADAKKENTKESANTDGNLTFATGVNSTVPVNLTGAVITSTSGHMENTVGRFEFESDRAERLCVLFETCEAVLLYCGPLLSVQVREAFTLTVHQGLACLAQGVLVPQFPDRHVHRQACARLRQDLTAQRLLLQLATVEVFSPPQLQNQAQQFSRNLPLLKRCAELCMRNAVTAAVAARALLMFSTLLHPVTVALPAVPAVDSARSYILTASDAMPASTAAPQPSAPFSPAFDGVAELFETSHSSEGSALKRTHEEPLATAIPAAEGAEQATPAKRTKSADFAAARSVSESRAPIQSAKVAAGKGNSRRASLDSAPRVSTPAAAQPTSTAASGAQEKKQRVEEDDESLPDIDIDADPDSD